MIFLNNKLIECLCDCLLLDFRSRKRLEHNKNLGNQCQFKRSFILHIKKIWLFLFRVEFIQLALDYKPLNLGQGLPDDLVPDYVINSLRKVGSSYFLAF